MVRKFGLEDFLLFCCWKLEEYFSQKNRIGLVQITTEKQNASGWAGVVMTLV